MPRRRNSGTVSRTPGPSGERSAAARALIGSNRARARSASDSENGAPCRACQAASTRGKRASATMWSRFGSPIGTRASATDSSMPQLRKSSTNAPMGARLPKSTTVPAQSKTTAASRCPAFSVISSLHGSVPRRDRLLADCESGAHAGAARHADYAHPGVRRIDEAWRLRTRVNSNPALDHPCLIDSYQALHLVQYQRLDLGRGERIGTRVVVVRIANDERAVGRADDDQMDTVAELLPALGFQNALQSRCRRQACITQVAGEAQVSHDRRGERKSIRSCDAQHLQLAQRDVPLAERPRKEGAHVRTGTYRDARRVDDAVRGTHCSGLDLYRCSAPSELDAVSGLEEGR